MVSPLPPFANPEVLSAALSRVPVGLREDAIQEAWVAHLEGGDPLDAIQRFDTRERRHKKRFVPVSQLDINPE
jgi:hypothetical protein